VPEEKVPERRVREEEQEEDLIGETPKRYWHPCTYTNHRSSRHPEDNPPIVVIVIVMMIMIRTGKTCSLL